VIKNLLKLFIFFFFRLIPKDKKLLVFGDRAGRRFADNSRYLFLYMSKNFKEFHCVWITKEKSIYEYLMTIN
jgi:CDP-glycerol glycerophosphotransferase (TagB/SpsB family)